MDDLKKLIREVRHPKPGILILMTSRHFSMTSSGFPFADRPPLRPLHTTAHTIVSSPAWKRALHLFVPRFADRLGAGFVPVRQPKKLPAKTVAYLRARIAGTIRSKFTNTPFSPAKARF